MIYNQQFLRPHKNGLNKYIGHYISYIAKNSISKVVMDKGKEHGLFGSIGNPKHKHIDNLDETIKHMRNKALQDRCILYHGFVSISTNEIKRSEFQGKNRWQQMIASKMSVIAKQNNIKLQDLEWVSAVHVKKEHSHAHLIFWDKNQQVKEPYIPPNVFSKKMEIIKSAFAREIFHDELKDLYAIKDFAFDNLSKEFKTFFGDFKEIISDMNDAEIKKLQKIFCAASSDYADYDMINPNFTNRQIVICTKEIMRIKKLIPKSGSLKYGYMSERIKSEIDNSVETIIKSNKACSRAYHNYINSAVDIREVYSDNPDDLKEAKQSAKKVISKGIGNLLLNAIKELNNIQSSTNDYDQKQDLYKNEIASDLITQIAFAISRAGKSNDAKVSTLKTDELSKQAKVELAKKLESKGIDWGQYER